MLAAYRQQTAERAALGIPPLPLTADQTRALTDLLMVPPPGEGKALVDLLTYRVPAGVDEAAQVKAEFLASLALGEVASPLVDRTHAARLLGTMLGGFNVKPLITLLDDPVVGQAAAEGLKKTLLVFDAFAEVQGQGRPGQPPGQGGAALLGRGGVVHLPPGGARAPHGDRVQGVRGDQHRRPVPGPGRLEPPGHPPARPGHAQEPPPGRHTGRARPAGPPQAAGAAQGPGPPGGLRGRRGGHRLQPQVRHQFGAVVDRRGHPVRAQQALRRRLPGRQDRPHLLQHHGGHGRAAGGAGRVPPGDRGRGGAVPLRRQAAQGRRDRGHVQGEVRGAVRRGARRGADPPDHRPGAHRQGPPGAGPARIRRVPPQRRAP